MKASLLLDHDPVPGGFRVMSLLKLEAEATKRAERRQLNLSLVIDRSGSMAGEKLHYARNAAALLVRRLAQSDVVSVVAFDDEVVTVAAPATGEHQQQLANQIESIQDGGSTNLSGGWLRGRELVELGKSTGAVNRVILLTDGQANVGITQPEHLAALTANANERGVTTTTIGFGAGYDENLLKAMADAGGGSTYYIEHADQAPSVFAHEIEGLLSLGAQNVTVDILPANATSAVTIMHSYPKFVIPGGFRLEIGDLYAREPRALLFDLHVPGVAAADPVEIARVIVRGVILNEDGTLEQREITMPLMFSTEGATVQPEVRREMLLLEAAHARAEALNARERGDFDGAARTLNEVAEKLRAAGLEDTVAMEEMHDVIAMSAAFASRSVSEEDAKYMHQRMYDSSRSMRSKSDLISRNKRRP